MYIKSVKRCTEVRISHILERNSLPATPSVELRALLSFSVRIIGWSNAEMSWIFPTCGQAATCLETFVGSNFDRLNSFRKFAKKGIAVVFK